MFSKLLILASVTTSVPSLKETYGDLEGLNPIAGFTPLNSEELQELVKEEIFTAPHKPPIHKRDHPPTQDMEESYLTEDDYDYLKESNNLTEDNLDFVMESDYPTEEDNVIEELSRPEEVSLPAPTQLEQLNLDHAAFLQRNSEELQELVKEELPLTRALAFEWDALYKRGQKLDKGLGDGDICIMTYDSFGCKSHEECEQVGACICDAKHGSCVSTPLEPYIHDHDHDHDHDHHPPAQGRDDARVA